MKMPDVMSTRLTRLTQQRDNAERDLCTLRSYKRLTIRQREHEKDLIRDLEYLNSQIEKLERKTNASRGPSRNKVRLGRA